MANIKSAKKRILVTEVRTERNAAIDANDKEAAKAALLAATSTIDKATSKGVYHKNYASRKISRLSIAVNKMD